MSDKPSFSAVSDLKAKIASTSDPVELVALYKQLVPMLKEPRKRIRDMSFAERAAFKAERKALREQGINLRTGLPWTPEQRAKQQAASEKARGRQRSPETIAKVRASAEARRNKQIAMEARLHELEALIAQSNGQVASESKGKGRK